MLSTTPTANAASATLVAIAPLLMYERDSWMQFFILLAYYGYEIICFFTACAILTMAIVCLLGLVVTITRKLHGLRHGAGVGKLLVRHPRFVAFCGVHYCLFLGTTMLSFTASLFFLDAYLLLLVGIWKWANPLRCMARANYCLTWCFGTWSFKKKGYIILCRIVRLKMDGLLQWAQNTTWKPQNTTLTPLKMVCVVAGVRHVWYCSTDHWLLLQYVLVLHCGQQEMHLTECHLWSSGFVMLCGALAGMPMKVVSMLACRELLHPTFGKRAAPTQEPSMMKRPAREAPSWKPEDHDVYLRKLLGAKPEIA